MAERGGECARRGGAELEAMQAPPLSALHGGSGRVRAAMLAKRSATEMEEGDTDGGDDEGGGVPSDVAEHRRWLSDLRADYTERLSLASFVSSEVASPSDDGEPDGEPRSSLMTRSSLDLDVDFSDEGDAAARWSPTTAAPLRRHSCPDGRLGGWRLADRAGGRADRAGGRADRSLSSLETVLARVCLWRHTGTVARPRVATHGRCGGVDVRARRACLLPVDTSARLSGRPNHLGRDIGAMPFNFRWA